MDSREFFRALITARGHAPDVERLPGAFNHRLVLKRTYELRAFLDELRQLPHEDQASFIKSLALYEQTVGGIGSPTLLFHALPVVSDPDHETFDWVLANTLSYDYYARGAKSFDELERLGSLSRARTAANREKEHQRAANAAMGRADRASKNLFSAIRRGDIKAVEALLSKGARTETRDANGLTAIRYADSIDKVEILELLRGRQDSL